MPFVDKKPERWGAFAPSRLTVGRQMAGLSKKELADRIRVAAITISRYENGSREPDEEQLDTIADVLGFHTRYFYDGDLDLVDPESLTFRARKSMTAAVREKATAYFIVATEIVSRAIRRRFKLPAVDVPDLSDIASASDAALTLRMHWGLGSGPITNLVHVAESHGIEVYWIKEDNPSVFAYSLHHEGRPYVVLNSCVSAGDRARFDLAHELGHLCLHYNKCNMKARDVETEANGFAAHFLMPPDQLRGETPRYPTLEAYFPLKSRWRTSIQSLIVHSYQMNQLSHWQYQNLFKQLAMRGWKKAEPISIEREQSEIHSLVLNQLSKSGISADKFSDEMNLPINQLEIIMPLAKQFRAPTEDNGAYSLSRLRDMDRFLRGSGLE